MSLAEATITDGMDISPAMYVPPPVRVGRLSDMRGVRRELARLYKDARTGNGLTPANAAKLAYTLTCLQRVLEAEVIEGRLNELERRLGERRSA